MYIKTAGLVLRATEYKESSLILTVLTASHGKLTVSARGARRKGSKIAAAVQLLTFSEMTLFSQRDRFILTEARSIEEFRGLRDDLEKLSLGSYFAELLETLSDQDIPDPEMLSLGLKALFALSGDRNSRDIIKAAFELSLMCLAGYGPMLDCCSVCGRCDMDAPVLSLLGGTVRCAGCQEEELGERVYLSRGALEAMRHITGCDPKRLYSFTVSGETEKQLSRACEAYLRCQLGREFRTLDFYRSLG